MIKNHIFCNRNIFQYFSWDPLTVPTPRLETIGVNIILIKLSLSMYLLSMDNTALYSKDFRLEVELDA